MANSKAENGLISELKKNGHKYKDVDDIFRSKSLKPVEVNLILKWLPKIYEEELGAGVILVQSLRLAKEPFDPNILIELFEESSLNATVKSGIGYAIVLSKTGDISAWIKKRLLSKKVAFENGALVRGLPGRGEFKNRDDLKQFLELIFPKYPIAVLEIYDKIGSNDDVDFLLEQIKIADKKLSKEIEKTLKKILKREGINKQ